LLNGDIYPLIDDQVPYSIGIETIGGDSDAMEFPSLNISSKGNVPSAYPQVFRFVFVLFLFSLPFTILDLLQLD